MRRHNRSLVLQALLLNGAMPRPLLAERTGLTQATISRITDQLLRAGLLSQEAGERPERDTPGRTPALIGIAPEGGHVLAMHLGAKEAQLTIADLRGRTGRVDHALLHRSSPAEPQLRALCRTLLGRAAAEGIPLQRIRGLGVGSSGVVDPAGVIVSHPWLDWTGVPVRSILEEEAGLAVFLDASVRAIANAEAWFGARRHAEPLTVVLVGNVVAAATVVRRSTLLGADLTEGQIGHLSVGGDRRCACGRVGCLEAEVRSDALVEKAQAAGVLEPDEDRPWLVVERARAGDERALRLLEERGRLLALGVVVLDAVVNPATILFIGPGFSEGDDLQLEFIRRAAADRFALPGVRRPPRLELGTFGVDSSSMGAASLALRTVFEDGAAALGR